MKYATALAATVLALAAAGAATAADQCFRSRDMHNHKVVDDHTLNVRVGIKEVWRIEVSKNCLSTADNTDPLITKTTGGSDLICKPLDLDLAVKRGTIASPCIVQSITKLTPEAVAALPKGQKP